MPDAPPEVKCNGIHFTEHAASIEIVADCSIVRKGTSTGLMKQTMKYEVFGDGKVKVETSINPDRSIYKIPSLARVGMLMKLNKHLFNMSFCGRGEVENYPDRKAGTEMGVWHTTAKDNEFDYIVPSENGNKTDCGWAAFLDTKGNGVCVVSNGDDFNLGASMNTQAELHQALHTSDLQPHENGDAPIYASIDHRMMGVAGDVR